MADFAIKAGDLLPVVNGVLTYSDGTPVNLTGATVAFVMRSQTTGTVTVNASAAITNATAGLVSYTWVTGDTATPGRYSGEWQVTTSGKRQTFPTDGYLPITIEESLTETGLPTRLVSLSDVKNHLRIANDDTNDAQLLGYIDAARVVVENITGPIVPVSKTEFFDGGNEYIALTARYIVSVDSMFENRGLMNYTLTNQPLGSSVDAFGYTWDGQTSILVRRSFGGSTVLLAPGRLNIGVTYTAGVTTIPANVRLATLELIRFWWQQGQQSNLPMPGLDNTDNTPATSSAYAVPNRVRDLLQPSKRFPAVG